MTVHVDDIARHRPRLDEGAVRRLLDRHYGVRGSLRDLPSDRDMNVAVDAGPDKRYVLKVSHAQEQRSILEGQHAAMEHVAARGLDVSEVVDTLEGQQIVELNASDERRHFVRLLTYVPGVPLASARPRSLDLLEDVGRFMGRLATALSDFDHPALDRPLAWDLASAGETVEDRIGLLSEEERRLVEPVAVRFRHVMQRFRGVLRRGIVHNDANDYNVLVSGPDHRDRRVVGLIDFGDALRSYVAADLAVAAAYTALDAPDPLRALSAVVAGYASAHRLHEDEVAVLFPMIGMRLCVSICVSAAQREMEPDNDYLTVSRAPALRLLTKLSGIHTRLAECVFRRDFGYEPCPKGNAVAAYIQGMGSTAPIVHTSLDGVPVIDLSTSSPQRTFDELTLPGREGEGLLDRIGREHAGAVVGRYGEVRLAYRGEQFEEASQQRTIHLGLDLFVRPATPIHAPLDGIVHSLGNNARPFDYGPTVILEHHPADGPAFYTLYGHLTRASIEALRPGDAIASGAEFAAVGEVSENGGWAPHLHFQIIADVLGHQGDFPGVASPWLRDVWTSISPFPGALLGLGDDAHAPEPPKVATLMHVRARHVGPSLSISYRDPLAIHRGRGAYLYDRDGQEYLDTVNNVAHVGHANPRVVAAVSHAMGVLNTNTRYLLEELGVYAERLAATLPDPLSVCYVVNSGSEANDLARRIAETVTGRKGVVVIDHAYHGNLSSLIEISPYKFNGRGGAGRQAHVEVAPMPDPYRSSKTGREHARGVQDAFDRASMGIGAFFAESVMGCGGHVFFPDGYLAAAYDAARASGGLCIADEVQTGFGRVGEAFWAFELHGVIPDIVTMGKPIGNGHPLGAVVTTPEIARAFDTGMEYFNTYGGNPVACAAGLAVLDALEEGEMQDGARRVGGFLLQLLDELKSQHEVVGDVRGSGLFLGVEFVRDRTSKAPAGEVAAYVVDRMREAGVLSGRDGPFGHVLKIKPPMVFGAQQASRFVETLEAVLREDFVRAHVRS